MTPLPELTLYHFMGCPYCQRVRDFLTKEKIKIAMKDINIARKVATDVDLDLPLSQAAQRLWAEIHAVGQFMERVGLAMQTVCCDVQHLPPVVHHILAWFEHPDDSDADAYARWRAQHPTCPPHEHGCPSHFTDPPIPLVGCPACEWENGAPL